MSLNLGIRSHMYCTQDKGTKHLWHQNPNFGPVQAKGLIPLLKLVQLLHSLLQHLLHLLQLCWNMLDFMLIYKSKRRWKNCSLWMFGPSNFGPTTERTVRFVRKYDSSRFVTLRLAVSPLSSFLAKRASTWSRLAPWHWSARFYTQKAASDDIWWCGSRNFKTDSRISLELDLC